jgi:polyisoprenoid-binding protein YceI
MFQRVVGSVLAVACVVIVGGSNSARAEDSYAVDDVHSSVTFKVSHLGLSYIHGRFDSFTGDFTINAEDPGKIHFGLSIKADTVDTNNAGRDTHLKSPDFFNTKQFATISLKSTAVKAIKQGYEVTGDLTMHGVTKPVTMILEGGGKAEFPKGTQRTGFSTTLTLKRSDFGMDKMTEAIGDEVAISIGLEGKKK